jgi:hypothetical protein
MMSKSNNAVHDAAVVSAEATRQAAVNVSGVSQATATSATVTLLQGRHPKRRQ